MSWLLYCLWMRIACINRFLVGKCNEKLNFLSSYQNLFNFILANLNIYCWFYWIFQQWICAAYVYSAHTEINGLWKLYTYMIYQGIVFMFICVHVRDSDRLMKGRNQCGVLLWYHLAKGMYPSVSLCMSIWHEWTSWKWHRPVERREWSVGSSCFVSMYLRESLQALWFLSFRCINRSLLFNVWLLL